MAGFILSALISSTLTLTKTSAALTEETETGGPEHIRISVL